MPVPSPKQYKEMLANAKSNKFAFPAINVASISTANAAISAFAETKSDGIIQFSIGAGKFASGQAVNDSVVGAISLAEHVHRVAERLDVFIAIHTDHCQKHELDFVRGLIDESKKRVEAGKEPLFNGHMFDGSALSLKENIDTAKELIGDCAKLGIILEVEAGIVGGEEDGAATTTDTTKLYTTPEDMLYVADELYPLEADFMFAATFGNVHGIYKPGNVKLNPEILKNGQKAVSDKYGDDKTFNLVFHGGSGTPKEQIQETLDYGVVKMNVDTATQFAYTEPLAKHVLENQDKILVAEGNKKIYDPRAYLKKAEVGMKERVIQALEELRAIGKTFYSK